MKRYLHRLFGAEFSARWSKTHITLTMLRMEQGNEVRLCQILREVCAGHQAFDLHFSGYGHFVESRTVFVNPVEKEIIASLASDLAHFVRVDTEMARRAVFMSIDPHMTIAKSLFQNNWFHMAWNVFKDRTYARQMRADKIILLRRGMSPRTAYEPVAEFMLGSMAIGNVANGNVGLPPILTKADFASTPPPATSSISLCSTAWSSGASTSE